MCDTDGDLYGHGEQRGSSPAYQWRKNGVDIGGATAATYTETGQVGNNDVISCYVTANAVCQAVNTAVSNYLTMHTVVNNMPTVNVSVYPAVYAPGITETFTAVITNGNATDLTFHWLKNGQPIGGATASTYASASLNAGDEISVLVRSDVPCTEPDSLVAGNIKLDVRSAIEQADMLTVYPNPGRGVIQVSSNLSGTGQIRIYNALGQTVYSDALPPTGHKEIKLQVPDGVYTVELKTADGQRSVKRLVIDR